MSTPEYLHDGDVSIVFDPVRIGSPWKGMFDPQWWRLHGTLSATIGGRGAAWRVERDGRAFGLRHYRRGGMMAWINRDRYLWKGLQRTRAYREWHLLAALNAAGLPVTPPVAARVVRSGPLYRADLLTVWIEGARPLPKVLSERVLTDEEWRVLGRTIRSMHREGVFHADLNAHNLLLGVDGRIHLVDFDRCERRMPAPGWQQANLRRLERSLTKLHASGVMPYYRTDDWRALVRAYEG